MSKATLVFTNFWQANYFIKNRILKDSYKVYSIALEKPSINAIPNLEDVTRLDFFCPTWDILNKYHNDQDWNSYTESFMTLMRTRKKEVADWLDNLHNSTVHLLCCWENTFKGSHCHRKLLYDALQKSKKYSNELNIVYMHGNEKNL